MSHYADALRLLETAHTAQPKWQQAVDLDRAQVAATLALVEEISLLRVAVEEFVHASMDGNVPPRVRTY